MPRGGPERLAGDHRAEQPAEDEERADGRVDLREPIREGADGEDRERAAGDGPDESAELRERTRPDPEQDGDHHQDDRERVDQVHGRIVAQGAG
jgi:hypothetical protein